MLPKSRKGRKPFTDLLQRTTVGKIAQNMKFEDNWTNVRLHIPVNNWIWDTMLASHILDNRPRVTGLKFQTYVQFGIIDYDSEVNPYLLAVDAKNANAINRIDELLKKPDGEKLLLKYCAMDSIFEYRLAMLQQPLIMGKQPKRGKFGSNVIEAYNLFHSGILALAKAERQGLRIDTKYIMDQQAKLDKRIKRTEGKIFETPLYKEWFKSIGKTPKLDSPVELSNFLYNVKKITPVKFTKGNAGSTDKEALKALEIPELDLFLLRSKYKTLQNTFLKGLLREQVNGQLHSFFNLHIPVTYRGSSSNVNFQNFPVRDEYQMKCIRGAIHARKYHQILDMDFGGIEVGVSVCYHKDPVMLEYIKNPKSDMHKDMAIQIFDFPELDKNIKSNSVLRSCAKNGFVFPQFYGDYYKNNAESICRDWVGLPQRKWKKSDGFKLNDDYTIGEHLISKGIKSYSDFTHHLKTLEYEFWNKRFTVYAAWKDQQWELYQRYGYVPLKTGFVCSGIMDKKNVSNYPIQGTAFHLLLWTLIEVEKQLAEAKMDSKIIGQIHDDVVTDVNPSELTKVYNLIHKTATVELPKVFKWINVPLTIDAELCPVNGSWAEKEKWKPD